MIKFIEQKNKKMTNAAIKLTITHFDSMENSVSMAEYIGEERVFINDNDQTAHSKCAAYVKSLNVKMYIGWNEEVYPQIKIEKIILE